MLEYQKNFKNAIDVAVEEQLNLKSNLKPAVPGAKKRSPAETAHDVSLPRRLALLKPRGKYSLYYMHTSFADLPQVRLAAKLSWVAF